MEEVEEDDEDDDQWNDMDDGATVTSKLIHFDQRSNYVDLDASGVDDEAQILGTPLRLEECLFCSAQSSNLEENLSHMAHAHSFFLPDFDYIKDLSGLIEYLGTCSFFFIEFFFFIDSMSFR